MNHAAPGVGALSSIDRSADFDADTATFDTATFTALADHTRWRILTRLGEGPASASALARELPVSRQAIVKHLEVLRGAGLVAAEPVGRELVHRALAGRLHGLARDLDRIAAAWDRRQHGIERPVEGRE